MTFDFECCSSHLGKALDCKFSDPILLKVAFTHKSYYHEFLKNKSFIDKKTNPPPYMMKGWGAQYHNERLEFLGDSVLDLVLSDCLMTTFHKLEEGDLSKLRASLVNEVSLYELALELKIKPFMHLGKGEAKTGGSGRPRILASAIEALIGAVYIDQGYEESKKMILNLYKSKLSQVDSDLLYDQDYKTRLQELSQKDFSITPIYEVVEEGGPAHERKFVIKVIVNQDNHALGEGNSKKIAAQCAAQRLLEKLL